MKSTKPKSSSPIGNRSRPAAAVATASKTKASATRQSNKSKSQSAASAKKSSPTVAAKNQGGAARRPPAAAKTPDANASSLRHPTRDEAAALRAFERAHKEFTRGRFAEARLLFRALIEQHGGVAEVTARARTYLNIAEARLRTESAPPRDAEALYDRGVIELNRGDYVAAQEMFERALKRDPNAADIHYALAATRARLGSIDLALHSLERALNLKQSLRVRAQHDPDLASLRNEPDYERMIFAARL